MVPRFRKQVMCGRLYSPQINSSKSFSLDKPSAIIRTEIACLSQSDRDLATDGTELFYIGLDERLMAVPIRLAPDGKTAEVDAPLPLFVTHIGGAVSQLVSRQNYVVSAADQRFLMNTIVDEAASPITLILNWKPKP